MIRYRVFKLYEIAHTFVVPDRQWNKLNEQNINANELPTWKEIKYLIKQANAFNPQVGTTDQS